MILAWRLQARADFLMVAPGVSPRRISGESARSGPCGPIAGRDVPAGAGGRRRHAVALLLLFENAPFGCLIVRVGEHALVM